MNTDTTVNRQNEILRIDTGAIARWQHLAGVEGREEAGVDRHLEIVGEQYSALCKLLYAVKGNDSLYQLASQYERELGALRFVKDVMTQVSEGQEVDETLIARVEEIVQQPRPFSNLVIHVGAYSTAQTNPVMAQLADQRIDALLHQHKKETIDELYKAAVEKQGLVT